MDLVVRIGATAQGFNDAMDAIEKKTSALSDTLASVGKVSGIAWAGLSAAVGLSVKAFSEADAVQRSLENTIKASGNAAGVTADEVMKMSSALQAVTTYGDETITSGTEMLLTFNRISGDTLPRATKAMLDISTAMKMDVSSAAFNLGKALQEPIEGMAKLKSAGISFTEQQENQVKAMLRAGDLMGAQNVILTEVEKKYKGAAEAAADGTGVFTQLKEVFGDVAEELGKQFAPALIVVAKYLKDFLSFVKDNEAMVSFAAKTIAMGVAITGIGTALSVGALAFIKVKNAIEATRQTIMLFSTATKVAMGATGVGLILLVLGEIYLNWESIWPKMYATYQAFVSNIGNLTRGLGKALIGLVTLDKDAIDAGLAQMKLALIAGYKTIAAEFKSAAAEDGKREAAGAGGGRFIPKDEITALAGKPVKEKDSAAEIELEKMRRHLEEQALLRQGYSQKFVDIERQEYEVVKLLKATEKEEDRAFLTGRLEEIRALKLAQGQKDMEDRILFKEQMLKDDADFQALSVEQQEQFITENIGRYEGSLMTERNIHLAHLNQTLADKAAANAKFIDDERKFGKTYAEIQALQNTNKAKLFKESSDEMAKMQNSSGNTLKAIGKGFAIKDIYINTAQAAMRIYAGFSTIPIIGPALGIAGAIAAVAFGAEQVGKVLAAASGGLVVGGIPGRDSVRAMLTPGELVVPRQSYGEIINAAVNSRLANTNPYAAGGAGGDSRVRIDVAPEASRFITAQTVEERELGLYRA